MRVGTDYTIRTFITVILVFLATQCVAKPTYRCTTDDACVSSDGTKGVCDRTGICDFSNVGSTSSVGGTSSVGDASSVGSGGARTCDADAGLKCYPCTPTNSEQIANACTLAACVPFDDGARLTKLTVDGGLPPLPTAP